MEGEVSQAFQHRVWEGTHHLLRPQSCSLQAAQTEQKEPSTSEVPLNVQAYVYASADVKELERKKKDFYVDEGILPSSFFKTPPLSPSFLQKPLGTTEIFPKAGHDSSLSNNI